MAVARATEAEVSSVRNKVKNPGRAVVSKFKRRAQRKSPRRRAGSIYTNLDPRATRTSHEAKGIFWRTSTSQVRYMLDILCMEYKNFLFVVPLQLCSDP